MRKRALCLFPHVLFYASVGYNNMCTHLYTTGSVRTMCIPISVQSYIKHIQRGTTKAMHVAVFVVQTYSVVRMYHVARTLTGRLEILFFFMFTKSAMLSR